MERNGFDLAILYRLAPAFVGGVAAGVYGWEFPFSVLAAAGLFSLLVMACLRPAPWRRWLPFALVLALAGEAGLLRAVLARPPPLRTDSLSPLLSNPIRARVRVLGGATPMPWGVRALGVVDELSVLPEEGSNGGPPVRFDPPLRVLLEVKEEKNAWIYSEGALLEVWGRLRVPPDYENPGVHTYRDYLQQQRIEAILAARSPRAARVRKWPEGIPMFLARRAGLFSRWAREKSPEGWGLVGALAVGNRSGVSEELSDALRATGTYHILSISGLHIAIAGGFFFFLARFFFLRFHWLALRVSVRKIAMLAALSGVVLYALLAGYSEATLRAALMFAAGGAALLFERRFSPERALLLAAAALLAADPAALAGISFQLSFAATAAIVLGLRAAEPFLARLRPEVEKKEKPSLRRRAGFLILRSGAAIGVSSLAANLATWPLVAFYFNRFSLNGLVANLFLLPLVEFVLLPASLLSLFSWMVSPGVAAFPLRIALGSSAFLEKALSAVTQILPDEFRVGSPAPAEFFFYSAAFAFLLAGAAYRKKGALCLGAALGGVFAFIFFGSRTWEATPSLRADVLDAGAAQVTLLSWSDGKRALVDTSGFAPSSAYVERAVLPAVLAQGGGRVDLLVYGGSGERASALPSYIEFFSPTEVWDLSQEILPRRWPPEERNPKAELLAKDHWRSQGDEASGWALLVSEGESLFLLDGAPGRWPAGWAERWRENPLAVQLSPRTLSSPSSKWLLARARPEVLLVPRRKAAREFSFGGEIVTGGWARLSLQKDGIEVEREH